MIHVAQGRKINGKKNNDWYVKNMRVKNWKLKMTACNL